jgi:chromosome segregation ATPase
MYICHFTYSHNCSVMQTTRTTESSGTVSLLNLEAAMFRLFFLPLVLLLVSTPALGQTTSKDSQTLQALLTEVRQLRQDLEATALVTHKLQILLYRLQTQNTTVARLWRSVEEAHADVNQMEDERTKLAADIKQHEEFISNTANASGDRKAVEDALPGLKEKLLSLDNQLQQVQEKESAAQEQLRSQQAKLERLEADFDFLAKSFETSQAPANDSQ